jgi:hypothetical protein
MHALDEVQSDVVVKNGSNKKLPSLFSDLRPLGPEGPFALEALFNADLDSRKVNLIIGAYRDDQGVPLQPLALIEVGFGN